MKFILMTRQSREGQYVDRLYIVCVTGTKDNLSCPLFFFCTFFSIPCDVNQEGRPGRGGIGEEKLYRYS